MRSARLPWEPQQPISQIRISAFLALHYHITENEAMIAMRDGLVLVDGRVVSVDVFIDSQSIIIYNGEGPETLES